jgi:predicted extracellular nuclease
MNKIFTILSVFFSFGLFSQAELPDGWDEARKNEGMRIAFYNLENLFDTIDTPRKRDEEFLPNADRKWNGYKYWDKLNKLSKVVVSLGGWEAPAVIGVCEIENDTVLKDLAQTPTLKKIGYQSVHFSSPDARGIDVGLLYNPDKAELIYAESLRVSLQDEPDFKTRDILYTKLKIANGDLHVFVNHWPSRRGGSEQSEYKRIAAAQRMGSKVDSIFEITPKANILIMGDFNDTPDNNSIHKELAGNRDLNNLMSELSSNAGSHKYRGHWSYLDQIIVSTNLIPHIKNSRATVFWQPWMVEEDSKHPGYYPKRTWRGTFYHGGYSDHLPVFVDIYYDQTLPH